MINLRKRGNRDVSAGSVDQESIVTAAVRDKIIKSHLLEEQSTSIICAGLPLSTYHPRSRQRKVFSNFCMSRSNLLLVPVVCVMMLLFCWNHRGFPFSPPVENIYDWRKATETKFRPIYPPLPDGRRDPNETIEMRYAEYFPSDQESIDPMDFKTVYNTATPNKLDWEEWYDSQATLSSFGSDPVVDYAKREVILPEISLTIPKAYPKLANFGDVLTRWPQDNLNNPPDSFQEELMHFDFSNPFHMEAAILYRNAELPFKVYNIPELSNAGLLWSDDDYLEKEIYKLKLMRDEERRLRRKNESIVYTDKGRNRATISSKSGSSYNICQESHNNFFGFYIRSKWDVRIRGPPPTKDNDWSFKRWAKHARYADTVSLSPNKNHYYYQVGIDEHERFKEPKDWSFVTKDLSLLGGPNENFFMFNAKESKGVQCRFGERGVVTAMHFDTGKNMVAMVTGAKRYILSPPDQCYRFGVERNEKDTLFRHSMLNFGRMSHSDKEQIPYFEREWLDLSSKAQVIDTILKAGEILYIPSNWFHYIISLQRSAQCNTRSGDNLFVDKDGNEKVAMACMDRSWQLD